MRTVAFPRVNRAGPRARQGRLHPRSGHGVRRKVVREGAGQAAVTGEGAGWRVRRRRLPGPRSPPGPEPAVRTLPGRRARASRGRARRAAAGKEVGAAPRDARASSMNAPCRVGCQGTGRPTGIPGTLKSSPRGARGRPRHARAAVVARHPGHELSPGTCPAGVFLDNARVLRRAGRHGGLRDPRPADVRGRAAVRASRHARLRQGRALRSPPPVPPGLEHLDLVLARELLDQGLIGPATFGRIRVWPAHDGRWTV